MNVIGSSGVNFGFTPGDLLNNTVNFVSSNGQFILIYVAVIFGAALIGYVRDLVSPPKKGRSGHHHHQGSKGAATGRATKSAASKAPKYDYLYRDGVRWRTSGTYKDNNRTVEYYNNWYNEWRPKEDFFSYRTSAKRR